MVEVCANSKSYPNDLTLNIHTTHTPGPLSPTLSQTNEVDGSWLRPRSYDSGTADWHEFRASDV